MYRRMKVLVLMCLVSISLYAVVAPENDLDQVVQSYIEREMASCRIPGLALAVVQDGALIYSTGFGKADQTKRAVSEDTPFLIGSLSKPLTAVAIMQLVERNLIALDDSIATYIVALQHNTTFSDISIRQLLTHTSSLPRNAEYLVAPFASKDASISQFVSQISELHLDSSSNHTYEYSNANYILLGAIIESVTGFSYADYMRTNITEPMDMQHTHFEWDSALADGVAIGYRTLFGFPVPSKLPHRNDFVPAYGIISSAGDMARFCIMLMNNGVYRSARILSQESVRQLFSQQVSLTDALSYGFGWYVTEGSYYHGGETSDYQAKIKILPSDGLALVMLYNTSSSTLTTLFNYGYRERLEGGIINLLYNLAPDAVPRGYALFDLNRYQPFVVRGIYVCLVLMIVGSLMRVISKAPLYHRSLVYRRTKTKKMIVLRLLVFHYVMPLSAAIGIPFATGMSWPIILYYIPDVGGVLAFGILVLLITGIYKTVVLFRYSRQ